MSPPSAGMGETAGMSEQLPALAIDQSTTLGARAARRLREETVVWMTTVGRTGAPAPNPVWFLWDGASTVTVFTGSGAARLRHLAANPELALNFDTDGGGGDVVVLSGTAAVPEDSPGPDAEPEYLTKYAAHIPAIGHTTRSFAQQYSVRIEVTLTRLRGL
jgi:PPOX class probable F420-dependent enzyme